MDATTGATGQVLRYYRYVDANDIEALLTLFSDDCVYERPGYEPLVGKQALTRFYKAQRVIESGRHALTSVVQDGDTVAVEGHFAGVLKSGVDADVRFADFFRFSGDRITSRHTYFFAASV